MNGNFEREPRNFGGQRRFFSPVREGDEVDVKVVAVGEKGDGIAKVKGFIIIVPEAKEGNELRIKITRVLKKVAFGEVLGDAQGPVLPTEREDREESNEEAPMEESQEDELPEQALPEEDDFEDEPADEVSKEPSEEEKKEE
jgi:predicted RNA-binding protein with TRAM domain